MGYAACAPVAGTGAPIAGDKERAIATVPLSVALVAGGLATLNPCGLPVLSAFLSYYLGTEEPSHPNRVARGLAAGVLVAAGFVGVFTVVGLPLTYGVAGIADAVPLVGLAFGIVLVALGVGLFAGRRVALPISYPMQRRWERRASTTLLFGIGYGVASFGCTLPVFLTVLGAAAGAGGAAAAFGVFGAYLVGMAVVLVALSVAAALLHGGLSRWFRRALPYLQPLTAGLLVISGGYLTYYWVRVEFGSQQSLVADPLIDLVTRFSVWIEAQSARGGLTLLALLGAFVVVTALVSLRQQRRRPAAGNRKEGRPDEHR